MKAKNAFGDGASTLATAPGNGVARAPKRKAAPARAEEPVAKVAEPEPWPPPVPVINGMVCVVMTSLPWVGTRVVKMRRNGVPQIGTVTTYEEFHPQQYTFPVRWGASTSMESVCPRTWELPESAQPDDRRPPRRTGMCARLDLEATQKAAEQAANVSRLPAPRSGAIVVEGTVLRVASA